MCFPGDCMILFITRIRIIIHYNNYDNYYNYKKIGIEVHLVLFFAVLLEHP